MLSQKLVQPAAQDAGKPPAIYLMYKLHACYSQPGRGKSNVHEVIENFNLFFQVRINVHLPSHPSSTRNQKIPSEKNCNGQDILNDLSLLELFQLLVVSRYGVSCFGVCIWTLIVIDGCFFLVLN